VIYALASYLAFALAAPFLLLSRKTRRGQRRRLGLYPRGHLAGAAHPRIWMHGASAGDLLALRPIARELRRRLPGCTIVMSALTDSGLAMARSWGAEVDDVTCVPWDLPGATRRAVRAIAPDLLVLEYAEIWPNLIHAAHRHGARVALTNGRFSPARLRGYRRLFRISGHPLQELDLLLMREADEAERALAIGAPAGRVVVTGNTKFDGLVLEAPDTTSLRAAVGAGPLFIAGSTHEGEEALILPVFRRLRETVPGLRLLVAPRYVDRAERIRALAEQQGFTAGLRTQGAASADVVVLDTIGELRGAYALGTLVFVGGSFTARGGQNILEPAGQGRPVLFGPSMGNFRDSVQVLLGRGGIQVRDADHLLRVASELLARPDRLQELGGMAREAVRSAGGAAARDAEHLVRLLPRAPEVSAA
jgi:3-deoxy-D-manno-octulosonic-acid transferase